MTARGDPSGSPAAGTATPGVADPRAAGDAAVVDRVHARAREEGLVRRGEPAVVMLSGGRDSTCLLAVAVEVCGASAVEALHVNHGLRAEAEGDEEHCRALCQRLGVPLAVRRCSPPGRGNVQAWGRAERYGAARRLATARGAVIAVGHTASDQVETILYRLASSPSRRALLGMQARRAGIVRPLLSSTREETTAYCRAAGLNWREDESNAGEAYVRSRVRHELVPALRRLHPAAEENVLALSELLRDEAAVLDAAVDAELAGASEIALARLRELPAALARLVVQRLADRAAGRPAPGTARRLDEILALSGESALHLPYGVQAVTRAGMLRFALTS